MSSSNLENTLTPVGGLFKLAEQFSDGLWAIDSENRTLYANAGMLRILASTSEDVRGCPATEFVSAEELEHLRGGEMSPESPPATGELALRSRKGKVWVRMHAVRESVAGHDGALIVLVQDISERHAADVTRSLLASIVESSDDAIVSKTLEGRITSWNKGAERVFGYTAEEAIGQHISLIFPQDRLGEEDDFISRLKLGQRIDHYETVRVRKDGTPISISVSISPIRDRDGNIVGASKVARDITLEREAERERGRLAAIVESSNDAIVSKSLDGIVTSWNRAAEELFGYSAEEMVGQPFVRIIPADRLTEEDMILSRVRSGEHVSSFETIRNRKDGGTVEVSVTVSPIRDAAGNIVGASKIARDIGPQKAVERSLRESEEKLRQLASNLEQRVIERTSELEAALREMEGFTYTISHDLRGPLRAIIASCRILQEDYAKAIPEDANRILGRQIAAANKMARLIDDLLRLSRLGRQELRVERIDVSAIVQDIARELESTAETAPEIIVQPDLKADADEVLLRLAVQNMLENSLKFTKPGEPAHIEFGREGDRFFVRDRGIGFEPQFADRIFAPFERLHRDTEYPGTGIGLANVRRIVERHKGRVWAEGLPDKGATIYFTLPGGK